MPDESSDSDDLWGYGGKSDDEAASCGDGAAGGGGCGGDDEEVEEEEEDDNVYLTSEKRKQLATGRGARSVARPEDDDIIFLSDDGAGPSKPRPATKRKAVELDDDDDWALTPPQEKTMPTDRRARVDPELADLLRQNTEDIQALENATKEAVVTAADIAPDDEDGEGEMSEDDDGEVVWRVGAAGATEDVVESQVVQKVMLCLRFGNDRKLKLRIASTAPFKKLVDAFTDHAVQSNWIEAGALVQLVFDGDVIGLQQTPAGLDCEDGDVIDVHC